MDFSQIMVLVALVWLIVGMVSKRIPDIACALGIPLILILSGIYAAPTDAMKDMISPTFLLIASILILLQGMFESGLAEAIGKLILKLTGGRTNETFILIIIIVVSTIMTMFLPNGGTCSILIPICIAVAMVSGVSRSRTLFVMNMAVGLGGCMTSMGTSINTLCRGMIQDAGFGTVSFFGFGAAAIPAYVIGIVFMLTIGRRLLPNWVKEDVTNPNKNNLAEMPDVTPEERAKKRRAMIFSGISFVLVIIGVFQENVTGIQAWVFGMVGVIVMLLSHAVNEKEAMKIPWGILLFVFACSALASGFKTAGIAELTIGPLTTLLGDNPSPIFLTAVMFCVGAGFTQIMSNFGTFGIFSSVAITLATAIGANPTALLIALAMGCNASYATPMATPANLFIVADGEIKFTDWLKNGLPQVLILGVCTIIFLPMFFPFY